MENQTALMIRKAVANDIDGIMAIERLSFRSRVVESRKVFEDRIAAFPDGFLVAVVDGENERKIVGYISSELWFLSKDIPYSNFDLGHSVYDTHRDDGEELYISSIAVAPTVRGGQIGKKLFVSLLETVQDKYKLKSAILLVNSDWQSACKMYQKEGFKVIDKIPGFFPVSESAGAGTGMIMRKSLSNEYAPESWSVGEK